MDELERDTEPPACDPRADVVAAAAGELGNSDPEPYWADALPGTHVPHAISWCGGFALWALHQAGLALGWHWEPGVGFLFRLPTTRSPDAGDVAYFTHHQHHAIVERVEDGACWLINGNGIGGQVTRSHVFTSSVTAFYSIAQLLPGDA